MIDTSSYTPISLTNTITSSSNAQLFAQLLAKFAQAVEGTGEFGVTGNGVAGPEPQGEVLKEGFFSL